MKKVIHMIVNENTNRFSEYAVSNKEYSALVEYNDRSTKWYYFDHESELPQYIQKFMHK